MEGAMMAETGFTLPTSEPRVVVDRDAPAAQTPRWFAAAAIDQDDLLATAPELIAASPSGDLEHDADLVGIYAPEYREHFSTMPAVVLDSIGTADPHEIVVRPEVDTTPRTSVQMGLLREIAFLDGA